MILLVLEAHRTLHLGDRIDERAQRVTGQRVIVAAGVDVFELAGLVEMTLGIEALEEKALDLVGRVERVAVFLELLLGETLQPAADVAREGRAVAIDHVAEDEHFARAEDVGRRPIECAPVQGETQVALALRREPANRRAVKRQIVGRLQQELLVVVEHVQAAFEVAEEHGDGLDALLTGEIREALLLELLDRHPVAALPLGREVEFFQFAIRKLEEVAQFGRHQVFVLLLLKDARRPPRGRRTVASVGTPAKNTP